MLSKLWCLSASMCVFVCACGRQGCVCVLHMCLHVSLCACTYLCIYVCLYVSTSLCVYVFDRWGCMSVYMSVCTCPCARVCVCFQSVIQTESRAGAKAPERAST